jgi:6-phosphogluconate dehydrogenase (decarboxylating)
MHSVSHTWTADPVCPDTGAPERFSSRGEAAFADRVLSAMRYQFGGHVERTDGK